VQPVAASSLRTKYEALQSRTISNPANVAVLQPIVVLDTCGTRIAGVSGAECSLGMFASNDAVVINVYNSMATISHCMFSGDAHATWAFASASEPPSEQRVLDQGFALLSAFTLEPDQPTDRDVIRKPAYRFPNR
jgi:hypothetical protein